MKEERFTDGGQPYNAVEGHLFNPNGKWKYEVLLDYSDCEGVYDSGKYWDSHFEAQEALARATERNTSGVRISVLGDYWTLVVIDPPNGFPIMVRENP